jgi:hypothetical protein
MSKPIEEVEPFKVLNSSAAEIADPVQIELTQIDLAEDQNQQKLILSKRKSFFSSRLGFAKAMLAVATLTKVVSGFASNNLFAKKHSVSSDTKNLPEPNSNSLDRKPLAKVNALPELAFKNKAANNPSSANEKEVNSLPYFQFNKVLTKISSNKNFFSDLEQKEKESLLSSVFDYESFKGITLIHLAVLKNKKKLIDVLIENGANVNSANKDSAITPLHLAVNNNYAKIAKVLIDGGANLNAVDVYNTTPLYYAVIKGYVKTVQVLIAAGAEVGVGPGCTLCPTHRVLAIHSQVR